MKYNTKLPTGKIDIHVSTLYILDEISKKTKISKNILFEISIQNLKENLPLALKTKKRKNFLISHEGWDDIQELRKTNISQTCLIEMAIHNLITKKTQDEIIELALQYKENRKNNKLKG